MILNQQHFIMQKGNWKNDEQNGWHVYYFTRNFVKTTLEKGKKWFYFSFLKFSTTEFKLENWLLKNWGHGKEVC